MRLVACGCTLPLTTGLPSYTRSAVRTTEKATINARTPLLRISSSLEMQLKIGKLILPILQVKAGYETPYQG